MKAHTVKMKITSSFLYKYTHGLDRTRASRICKRMMHIPDYFSIRTKNRLIKDERL